MVSNRSTSVLTALALAVGVVLALGLFKSQQPNGQYMTKVDTYIAQNQAFADSLKAIGQNLDWRERSLADREKYLDRQQADLAEAANWLRDGKDVYTEMCRPFEYALATGYRQDGIRVNSVAHEVLLTLEERAKFSGVMALAENGSYSDLVLPCLNDYETAFDSLIVTALSDSARAEIFFRFTYGLYHVLGVLDAQIWAHEKFRRRADRDFSTWYTGLRGYAPADSDRYGVAWEQFKVEHPRYGQPWPGFWSSTVSDWQDDRPIGDYHAREKRFLEREITRLGDRLTLEQYRTLAKRFPDRIAFRSIG